MGRHVATGPNFYHRDTEAWRFLFAASMVLSGPGRFRNGRGSWFMDTENAVAWDMANSLDRPGRGNGCMPV